MKIVYFDCFWLCFFKGSAIYSYFMMFFENPIVPEQADLAEIMENNGSRRKWNYALKSTT